MSKKLKEIQKELAEIKKFILTDANIKWVKIIKQLDRIKGHVPKIVYLLKQDIEYSDDIVRSDTLSASSGIYISNTYPHKIGMDKFIENKIKEIQLEFNVPDSFIKTLTKQHKIIKSYKWQNSPKELENLYNKMCGVYIESNTSLQEFKDVFSYLNNDKVAPLKWHEDNAAEVGCFNELLINYKKVDNTGHIYVRLKNFIVKPSGLPFTCEFKVITSKDSNLASHKREAIKALLSSISK